MIEELKSSIMLKEFRGKAPYDVTAFSKQISHFSYLINALEDHMEEADLNPMMVFKDGKGVKVADALVKVIIRILFLIYRRVKL
ncbi:acetate--CoA ligase family protein [Peribacillus frigoritolerans]|nr:acetate--CoA ligase family protein [Peribacillus frigoritolerans]